MDEKSRGLSVSVIVIALGACLAVTTSGFAQSQAATATLSGRIADKSGAVMGGVNIELLETETGALWKSVSDAAGLYDITNLTQGTYKLTAKLGGFSDVVISPIELQVGQTANIDVTMEPGKLTQHVEVSASALRLQTQTSELSQVLPLTSIKQLPTVSRSALEFLALMPGVTASYVTGAGTGGQNPQANNSLSDWGRADFEAGGTITETNLIMVDGISINAQSTSGAESPKIVPSPDITQEFSLETNNISPEYGRATNVVNIITKHGTNALHGNLYEFVQNTVFNANNFINNSSGIRSTKFNKNQFGGTLGGPVYIPHLYDGRDHTWFFGSFEQLRQSVGGSTLMTIPTAAEDEGNFSGDIATSGTPLTIYNPTSTSVGAGGVIQRQPFMGNIIPSGMINPFAQGLLSYYPKPNVPGGEVAANGVATNINNFDATTPAAQVFTRMMARGDHQIGSNQRIMVRWEEDLTGNPFLSLYGNIASPVAATAGRTTWYHNAEISHTWAVSPTFVIQQSVGWTNEQFVGPAFTPGFDPTSLGGPFTGGQIQAWAKSYGGGTIFPNIGITNYGGFGASGLSFYSGDVGNGVYYLNLTKEKGRHELKSGFQFQYDPQYQVSGLGTSGDYSFSGQFTQGNNPLIPSAFTGDGFADFLLGYPATGGLSSQERYTSSSSYYAWYFLDNFKATSHLTFNLGLRYEFNNNFTDRFNETGGIDPFIQNPIGNMIGPNTNGGTLNQALGRTIYGGVVFAGGPEVNGSRRIIPNDYHDVGPRLGFAYQLNNKTVIRGGISRIYAQSLGTAANSGAGGSGVFFVTTPIVGTIDGIHPNVTIDNPFPGGILTPTGTSEGLLTGVGLAMQSGVVAPLVTPYEDEWNLGFQRAVTANSVLSVAYAASRGRHLACPGDCGDQLSQQTLAQYGSSLLSLVPNPFYGIITNSASSLSQPNVQQEQLLKDFPQYTGGSLGSVPSIQGSNSWPIFDQTRAQYPFISNWNALEVSYEMRNAHGIQLMVAYTLSKHITNADSWTGSWLSPSTGFQDLHNPLQEMSVAASDVPQRLVISHVIDLPVGRGKRFANNANPILNKVIGGWQWSGIVTLASGMPVPISQSPNNLDDFIGDQRPDLLATPHSSSGSRGQRISQWFANPTTTFAAAPAFTYGDAPRLLSSVRSDPEKNYDASLIKFTPISEKVNTEFRVSFFNAFNRPWFAQPNSTFGSPTFGLVNSLNGPPRFIELSLRLNW